MITPQFLAEIKPPTNNIVLPDGKKISSASGLVRFNNQYYIICDDYAALLQLSLKGETEQKFELPFDFQVEPAVLKKSKFDFESIAQFETYLVVFPSASKPNRMKCLLVDPDFKFSTLDFTQLFQAISKSHDALEFSNLNIEGSVFLKDKLVLFNRSLKSGQKSVAIEISVVKAGAVDSSSFVSLTKEKGLSLENIRTFDLEMTDKAGQIFSLTDAVYDESRKMFWLLSAIENTTNSYDDGDFQGAALFALSSEYKTINWWPLSIATKPEGLAFHEDNRHFLIVTDTDDVSKASQLYRMPCPI